MTRLSEDQITALFREPRTMRKFTDRPVTDDQLREIQELTYLGPTAFNSQPLRITWIKEPSWMLALITGADFEAIAADAVLLGE